MIPGSNAPRAPPLTCGLCGNPETDGNVCRLPKRSAYGDQYTRLRPLFSRIQCVPGWADHRVSARPHRPPPPSFTAHAVTNGSNCHILAMAIPPLPPWTRPSRAITTVCQSVHSVACRTAGPGCADSFRARRTPSCSVVISARTVTPLPYWTACCCRRRPRRVTGLASAAFESSFACGAPFTRPRPRRNRVGKSIVLFIACCLLIHVTVGKLHVASCAC